MLPTCRTASIEQGHGNGVDRTNKKSFKKGKLRHFCSGCNSYSALLWSAEQRSLNQSAKCGRRMLTLATVAQLKVDHKHALLLVVAVVLVVRMIVNLMVKNLVINVFLSRMKRELHKPLAEQNLETRFRKCFVQRRRMKKYNTETSETANYFVCLEIELNNH